MYDWQLGIFRIFRTKSKVCGYLVEGMLYDIVVRMGVNIQRHAGVGMPHEILKTFDVDAGLLHADDVHIALAQHEPPGRTALGDLQRKYRVRLVVDQRFRAVDVFGLGVIQHAAAKGNDVVQSM